MFDPSGAASAGKLLLQCGIFPALNVLSFATKAESPSYRSESGRATHASMKRSGQQNVSSGPPSLGRLALARVALWLARNSPSLYEFWASLDNDRWRAPIPWAQAEKRLSDCRVALVSSGGIILEGQEPFALEKPGGDCSFRVIPGDAEMNRVRISHLFYDHGQVNRDPGVMLPLPALRRLAGTGTVSSVAPRHFSFSGGIPDPRELVSDSAPRIASMMIEDGVDLALLTPA